jgi:GLPGLI family protein
MKIIYIVFFSFLFANAQEHKQIPIFEYEINYNLGSALVKKGYVFQYNDNVYYNTTKSVFLEKKEKLTINKNTGIPNINIMSAGNGTENNISLISKKNHFDSYSLGNEVVATTETLVKQNWKLTGVKKTINKRNCVEMTTTFRGRDYIAFIDLSVPVNFGPWKFNNFPGLPVLITDTQNKLKWTLSEIKNETKENIENFIKEQKEYLNSLKQMTLKEYVKLDEETNHGHTLIVSRMPREYKREKSNFKRGGFELIFEWEE